VARLAACDWPGNVRQLRNVVRQLAVASRGAEVMEIGSRVERILTEETRPTASATTSPSTPAETALPAPRKARAAPGKHRDPSEVGDDELIAALAAHQFRLQPAAAALGVSQASDLGREEIAAAADRCGGRVETMAEDLKVSKQGLKMRMTELGLR
jgi:two-component system nitrogen regulation response regulator GlnG